MRLAFHELLRIIECARMDATANLQDALQMRSKVTTARHIENLIKVLKLIILFMIMSLPVTTGNTAVAISPTVNAELSYADMADLADAAPLIAIIRVQGIKNVNVTSPESPKTKLYYRLISGKIDSLIRGEDGVVPVISFLVEADKNGKASSAETKAIGARPAIGWRRGQTVLIFARSGAQPGSVQLVSQNAAQKWSPEIEATTRAITSELLSASAVSSIMGVGDAFHVAGTIAGESETQIFLKTETGVPVSLSILHRPGEAARWGVSLGEVVDDAAVPPARNTLLWYRLACGLPDVLPASSSHSLTILDAEAAQRDYQFVMESLGSCGRTL